MDNAMTQRELASPRAGGPEPSAITRSAIAESRTRSRRSGTGARAPWWFLLPALAVFTLIVVIPSWRGAFYALTNWDGLSPQFDFVGFENFVRVFKDSAAGASILNTMLYAVGVMVVQNFIGLLLALGVNSAIRSRNWLRVLFFAPAVVTPLVVANLWQYILAPEGALNTALRAVGLDFLAQDWLGNAQLALPAIISVVVWQFAGYSMVIFLAGLQSIPEDVYEAASLDGAGSFKTFWNITRPLLAPSMTINLMLSLIGGLKLFDQVLIMTQGGPGSATESLSTIAYKDAFQFQQFGYSTALTLVLTAFVAVASLIQFTLLRRGENK
ncbi:sugar ABC transporter permease [Arthrobacter terricola]|uniref:Sugar ABC transporter permease n=2 Tax=Arthrobacter TaxID=1663 RepID=A0A4R5KBZ1_9MICC|nr:sugar ABC transporter permease [Arthrobacter terricola]